MWVVKSDAVKVILFALILAASNTHALIAQDDNVIQGIKEQCAVIDALSHTGR